MGIGNGGEGEIVHRLAALESAITALSSRLDELSARVQDQAESLQLSSDVALYAPLRDLLREGRFREADHETARVLFDCINSTLEDVTPEAIETFPITPLRIIDRLWSSHSDNRFGFSVQLKIYRELGGSLETLIAQNVELYLGFCDRVGWRKHGSFVEPEDQDLSESSAHGSLPRRCWSSPYGMKITNLLMARLISGGLSPAVGGEPTG
ncbi:GUN4 domain-containing protein [Cyanobium sp. AMD-g]|uniref:GUN4 domain-containing protein n=1 Tax=Cyanobium sp. AMD-g TaxID=2823699 RepID=UPI0020CDFB89|nr:GUN4 domain-containing protein [Cyanobium sp. AMD-g]MCP9932193.1 GUN4 domain-containing protein [Cyanobium sp. AMD-g]